MKATEGKIYLYYISSVDSTQTWGDDSMGKVKYISSPAHTEKPGTAART